MFRDRFEKDRAMEYFEDACRAPDTFPITDPIDEYLKRIDKLQQSIHCNHSMSDECKDLAELYDLLIDCRYPGDLRGHWPRIRELLLELEPIWQRYSLQWDAAENRRPDDLQKLIEDIAKANPKITCPQLLEELKKHKHGEVIERIEAEEIRLTNGKTVAVSGLKDRLSRAKKNLKKISNKKIRAPG